jgi:hypothetical protein
MNCRTHRRVARVFAFVAAGILLQTLYFKFTGAPESKYIFTRLGVEPWGRIATGLLELVAAALLVVPRTSPIGGLFAAGLMGGAVMSHLTRLGIVVQDDGGLLFALALTVLASGLVVAWLERHRLPWVGSRLPGASACSIGPTADRPA